MAQLNFRNATLIGAVLISTMSNSVTANPVISLDDAIIQAITNDPWVNGNNQKYRATLARSSAVATMSDPLVSVSLMNVPVDSMDFNQENMTQLKVGVSQLLPRGNVLDIKQAKLTTSAQKYPLMQEERKAQLTLNVTHIWLDIYLAQKTINLITRDKTLFEQTADVARASYSSTVGKTRQQDVIRSQLELIQLDDRLAVEYQKLESAIARLNEWLHVFQDGLHDNKPNFDAIATDIKVTDSLPSIPLRSNILSKNKLLSRNSLAQLVSNHPTVRLIDVDQKVALKDVEIAKEQYKPQWGINASYAYRDAMENGDDRADFFSIGVTFDVPLFTNKRQDKLVSASISDAASIRTDHLLLTKSLITQIEKEYRNLQRLTQRQQLYITQLITQTHEQAEASLTAYTNDDGDFSEVIRARIAELNTQISALNIDINLLKATARINYLTTQSLLPYYPDGWTK
ncbi:TolC family protein [Psychrosphaera sp. B3R10]|uniref:TolC family protein n=1 Tax=unclassified Psychrosphaera TaxID=2641570 RepID=UPI001C092A4A|nr:MULTISPECIES: TolC family protein [unclassified Psychrosphaera]MBU2882247.1 TolC family protein [Psychrosphaera sp. I2R16]MBU2988928.1 TolC family protein [Psychrosphaera sp. B3R10]